MDLVAVLTGDLVKSSQYTAEKRVAITRTVLTALEGGFGASHPPPVVLGAHVFRGDSFQFVLANPVDALHAALGILVHTNLKEAEGAAGPGMRIGIGIGDIDYRNDHEDPGTWSGSAFTRSGQVLDAMRTPGSGLRIRTGDENLDGELRVHMGFLNRLIGQWSREQARVILEHLLRGRSQVAVADELGITQSAVAHRWRAAGGREVAELLNRFRDMMERHRDRIRRQGGENEPR